MCRMFLLGPSGSLLGSLVSSHLLDGLAMLLLLCKRLESGTRYIVILTRIKWLKKDKLSLSY